MRRRYRCALSVEKERIKRKLKCSLLELRGVAKLNYEETKGMLEDYKKTKVQIEILKQDLKCIQETGHSSIKFDIKDMLSKNNKTDIKKSKDDIEKTIFILENKLLIIDKAIGTLNKLQKDIIIKKVINDEPYYKVCGELFIGERYARKLQKQAILKVQEVINKNHFT